MTLLKHCLAATLFAAAAAFVTASAQTRTEGVVQPATPASQPVVHAVPAPSSGTEQPPAGQPAPQSKSQPAPQAASAPGSQAAPKPAPKPASKPVHKPAHKPVHKPAYEPAYEPAPQNNAQPPITQPGPAAEPPILHTPAPQPAVQPAPTPQPVPQPAPRPAVPPAPAQQPAPLPAPLPAAPPALAPTPQPNAQPTSAPQPYVQPGVQPVVTWTLQVIRDGQLIDSFNGTTTVGQARTDTHHNVVSHRVGCKEEVAGSIDLLRTITVSPLRANATQSILSIEAQETLEDNAARQSPSGCKLPPQPRQVNASHPGLVVPAGHWFSWPIVDRDPALTYRVRASVAPPSQQP